MDVLSFADYAGTCAFAVSGTLSGTEKKFDLFGAAFIGIVTAIGGGTVRDIMMGVRPVTWIVGHTYFSLIILSIIATFIFYKHVIKLKQTLFLFDTIGIGVFTVIGVEKALAYGLTPEIAILMGLMSAVVGGVSRDTLCNEVPLIFHKEIYATACIVGGLSYVVMLHFNANIYIAQIVSIAMTIIIRLLAIKYNLQMPKIIYK